MRIVADKMALPQLFDRHLAEIGNRAWHVRVTGLFRPVIIGNRGRLMVRCLGVPVTVGLVMTVEIVHCDRRRDMINQMQTACRRWRGKTDRAAKQRQQSQKFSRQNHRRLILSFIAKRNWLP